MPPELLVGLVIGAGVLLIMLVRYARKRNKLLAKDPLAWSSAWSWGSHRTKFSYKHFFFGNSSSIENAIAYFLIWSTIVVVAGLLLFLAYILISKL